MKWSETSVNYVPYRTSFSPSCLSWQHNCGSETYIQAARPIAAELHLRGPGFEDKI